MTQAKIWFILSEGQVKGPHDQSEIETLLVSAKDPQIWGRGMPEWLTPSRWRQNLKNIQAPPANSPEAEEIWHVRIEGKEKNPFKYSELIPFLKTLTDFSAVDVRHGTNAAWKEVYAVPRVVEALGISRRSHPRVPIVGTLDCKSPQGDFTSRVISISEGGLGINDAKNLQIGQKFKATLTSPNLFSSIDTTCEVVYVGNDGYAGLRFIGLPAEFKNSIIEYVNKFASA